MDSFAFGYDVCPRCAFASRYKKRTSIHKRPRTNTRLFFVIPIIAIYKKVVDKREEVTFEQVESLLKSLLKKQVLTYSAIAELVKIVIILYNFFSYG